ncbi:hypothetical protein B0H13DRAFT_2260998 [Mycena leptocephala]|nr:hypothetical protein B0H13DRAFT_2260998 [Mycena leptocephala]
MEPPDEKIPKRPLNAFILFARQRRSSIGGKVAESSKILAKEWREMRVKKKKKFYAQAQSLRTSFREDFPDFKYTRRMKHRPGKFKSSQANSNLKESASTASDGIKAVQHTEDKSDSPQAPVEHQGTAAVTEEDNYSSKFWNTDDAVSSITSGSGLRLEEYKGSFKSNWMNPYPYDGNGCLWQIDDKWERLLKAYEARFGVHS